MWHTLITCIAEPKSDSRKPAHAATGSARSRNTSGSAPNDTPTPQIAPLPPLTNTNPNSTASFIHRQTPPATIPARTHSQLQISTGKSQRLSTQFHSRGRRHCFVAAAIVHGALDPHPHRGHNGKNPVLASILLFLVTIASASP
ncbi:hypothetical protein PVAP13_5NG397862 [Panicum virgatum]|uniref:Uncharacterized protein n=1 Tax=Panicum virgatum TaxID=38727 RepID=A0A8T0RW88_PANVG|nr:hypothetical protein PVAP13_5NG397862 [Panicum virgatum]